MTTPIFTGSGVAICTPFTDDGSAIDFTAYARLLDFQLEGGTDAIIAAGTTGEPSTMSEQEKDALISFTVTHIDHRIPVIAGTGGNDTKKVIEASQRAQKTGADGLLIVTPYYNKCTQKGLVLHYQAIAREVDIPIIIYNVPSRTGLNMLPETLAALIGTKNIAGIKESSGDIVQIGNMCRLCGEDMDIYSGEDGIIVPLMSLGGRGIISVAANIVPRDVHHVTASFLAGDIAAAMQGQLKLLPLVKALFCEVNPIPAKTALRLMGMCNGLLRMPLCEMEPQNLAFLERAMREYGIQY